MKKIFLSIYFFACMFIVFTNVSYAYIDPSAMTYVIQIVSAVVIAISTSVGVLFFKLKKFFKRNKKKEKNMNLEEILNNGESK